MAWARARAESGCKEVKAQGVEGQMFEEIEDAMSRLGGVGVSTLGDPSLR